MLRKYFEIVFINGYIYERHALLIFHSERRKVG